MDIKMLTISRACAIAAMNLPADSFARSWLMWKKLFGFSHVSTMPTNACNYQRVHTRVVLNYCWRRKWAFLIALTSCVIVVVLFTSYPSVREANITERDTYLDDVPEELYQTGEIFCEFVSFFPTYLVIEVIIFFLSLLQCWGLGITFPPVSGSNKFIRRYLVNR